MISILIVFKSMTQTYYSNRYFYTIIYLEAVKCAVNNAFYGPHQQYISQLINKCLIYNINFKFLFYILSSFVTRNILIRPTKKIFFFSGTAAFVFRFFYSNNDAHIFVKLDLASDTTKSILKNACNLQAQRLPLNGFD